jgi:3-oxo-5-alpha-steroid 4-dehydrogenase 1
MYLIHYSIRSIISPLVLAPKRSPQHISVTLASIFFNLMNGYLVGSYIAGDPIKRGDEKSLGFLLGLIGWAVGLAGNGKRYCE